MMKIPALFSEPYGDEVLASSTMINLMLVRQIRVTNLDPMDMAYAYCLDFYYSKGQRDYDRWTFKDPTLRDQVKEQAEGVYVTILN